MCECITVSSNYKDLFFFTYFVTFDTVFILAIEILYASILSKHV
jgi:hypothetical protein